MTDRHTTPTNRRTCSCSVCAEALTQQGCGGGSTRTLVCPGGWEALWRVAAAVVQTQLLPRGFRSGQLLRHLLLPAPFLTPQFMAVLPQRQTRREERDGLRAQHRESEAKTLSYAYNIQGFNVCLQNQLWLRTASAKFSASDLVPLEACVLQVNVALLLFRVSAGFSQSNLRPFYDLHKLRATNYTNKTDRSPALTADILQQLYAFLTLHVTKDFMPKLDRSNAFLHSVQ